MDHNVHSTVNNLADGDAAVRFLREQEAIRRARVKHRWITFGAVLAAMFVLMVGCGIAVGAAASGGSTATTSAATTAPAVPTPTSDTGTPTEPAQSYSAPAIEAPATQAPSTELPRTWITDGMWVVGDEIEPGTYRSPGPADDVIKMCYIDAKIGDHYAVQEVSDNGPVRVTVAQGQIVNMNGCQPFAKVS